MLMWVIRNGASPTATRRNEPWRCPYRDTPADAAMATANGPLILHASLCRSLVPPAGGVRYRPPQPWGAPVAERATVQRVC